MRMLLIERDHIHIENEAGETIAFKSLDELEKYTGVDLFTIVDTNQVTYEPRRKLHLWFDGIDTTEYPVPYPVFEDLIDQISILSERKEDPYYILSLEDAKKLRLQELEMEETQKLIKLQDIPDDVFRGAILARLDNDSTWTAELPTGEKRPDGSSIVGVLTSDEIISRSRQRVEAAQVVRKEALSDKDKVARMTTVEAIKKYKKKSIGRTE